MSPEEKLCGAAWRGNVKKCKALIAEGAYLNFRDKEVGWTPLHYAASEEHFEICEILIAAGANVDHKDRRGKTPLHHSASRGKEKVCKFLIAAGADIYCKAENGDSPLSMALLWGGDIAGFFRSVDQRITFSEHIGEGRPALPKPPPL